MKAVSVGLLFIIVLAAFYLYRQGKITLWFQELDKPIVHGKVGIPFADKEYNLSYVGGPSSSLEIAGFEEGEDWVGDGELDYAVYFEGSNSFFLSSNNHRRAAITLEKNLNIERASNFKFMFHLETAVDDLEEFNLYFINESTGYSYEFAIRGLDRGWNLLTLPRERFFAYSHDSLTDEDPNDAPINIEKVVIELISRPKTRSIVNLDSLWVEKDEDYLKKWHLEPTNILSIRKNGNSDDFLIFIKAGAGRATLREIGYAKNYTIQAKFTPLREGIFAFFLRGEFEEGDGYYLEVGGVGTNDWRIYKQGVFDDQRQRKPLAEGKISNFRMEKKSYWLKAEMENSKIVFYLSIDGENFAQLAEVKDETFVGGAIGIATSGESLFFVDDFHFFQ